MPKRLSDSDLWNRDWFLNLDGKHQLFCLYLRDHCDHAGVWRPSFKRFEQSTGFRVNPKDYLAAINADRERVRVLLNGNWWITGFIEDQYRSGMILDESVLPIKGVLNSLRANEVPYESCGYKLRVRNPSEGFGRSKEKEKKKMLSFSSSSSFGFNNNINSLAGSEEGEKTEEVKKRGVDLPEREATFKAEIQAITDYPREMLDGFFNYWSEADRLGKKMRFEREKTWDLKKRLANWYSRSKDYGGGKTGGRQKLEYERNTEGKYDHLSPTPIGDST